MLLCTMSCLLEALWFKDAPWKFYRVIDSSVYCQQPPEETAASFYTYNAGSPPGPCRELSFTLTVKDAFSELWHLLRYLDYGFRHLDYR